MSGSVTTGGSILSVTTTGTGQGHAILATINTAMGGTAAIKGVSAGGGTSYAIYGDGGTGYGIYGQGVLAGEFVGTSASAIGVRGTNTSTTGGYGVYCSSGRAAGCGGNQNWTNVSDARLKERVITLPEERGLDAILKLRPVTFHWKDRKLDRGNGQRIGLIAQEVEAVFPEMVHKGVEQATIDLSGGNSETVKAPKTLAYSDLVVPLIKAVQELKADNDNLRGLLKETRAEVDLLKGKEKH